MLAIGIDPGTAICGFGLVEMIGNRLRPVHYGAVFTDKNMLPEMRLKKDLRRAYGTDRHLSPGYYERGAALF